MEQLVFEMEKLVKNLSISKKQSDKAAFVRKRDGRVVEFDATKITKAIANAFDATGEADPSKAFEITLAVVTKLDDKIVDIEHIQDIVEECLLDFGFRKTAKSYILYRAKRAEIRNIEKTLSDSLNVIEDYVNVRDWRVNENSNMSYSLQA